MVFAGRVESRFTVPSSVTASVATGALSSAVAVTTPAANYYHTTAGGVSSWATAFQTAINAAVTPYPQSAAALQSAIGYGTWSAGWGLDIASGNDTGLFGGVTLTAVSSPTYGTDGPTSLTTDLAIGFDSAADAFTGGDNFDLTAAGDLCIAWVGKHTGTPAGSRDWIGKFSTTGYSIWRDNTGALKFAVVDNIIASPQASVSVTGLVDEWHVGIAVVDRAAGFLRIGVRGLTSGTSAVSSTAALSTLGNCDTAGLFSLGVHASSSPDTGVKFAALYVGAATGAAASMSANLSTALTNFANAINSSFTVSIETTNLTGRYTISNSFYPFYITWTDTTQRDVAGYAYDIDYPQTAAQMATALGYGTWTSGAGYLLNESSGNPAAIFGSPSSLTAVSSPTYSTLGARGGADKAIGFDSAADAFSGGNVFNVGASDDLIIVWVGKTTTTPGSSLDWFGKFSTTGYTVWRNASGVISCAVDDGPDTQTATCNQLNGEWHVGVLVLERAASALRIAIQGLRSGTANVGSSASTSAIGDLTTAGNFLLGVHASASPDTDLKIGAFYVVAGSGVATGLSANLSTAVSNFATYMKSQTGTEQAEALWFPDSPLNCDDHPSMCPPETDSRSSESPTGVTLTLAGNEKYVHKNVRWDNVPVDRIRERSATYANASLEHFYRECVTGLGSVSWLSPGSPLQVYWNNAGSLELLGSDGPDADGNGVAGWSPAAVPKFGELAKPSVENWVGQFDVRFPRLVSSG